jgi:predicted RNA binding protein YcfA (HicA-like mRNA interferase family)
MPIRLSGKDVMKALAKAGWVIERVSGSHHVMSSSSDGRHVSIPVHGNRPLPAGTLASICRSVGLSASQLRDLL